jgi:hypothetical protein
MHDKAFGAHTPAYPAAMQLDRKLRAHPVPPVLQIAGYGGAPEQENLGGDSPGLILQRHTVVLIRESSKFFGKPAGIVASTDIKFVRFALSSSRLLCEGDYRPSG